jgi:hypothetical protein
VLVATLLPHRRLLAAVKRCPVAGCSMRIRPNLSMCARHWSMVPIPMRARIWEAYRYRGAVEHLAAIRAAIVAVQNRELEAAS